MKCHLAIGSYLQSGPVVFITLLEDDALFTQGVAGDAKELNLCIRCGCPGDTCVGVDLKHGVVDVKGVTVSVCDVPRGAGF
jgi:hypothetical protein